MSRLATSLPFPRGSTLKWLVVAAIAMSVIATLAVTAVVQAQTSNAPNPPYGLAVETRTSNSIQISWLAPIRNNCQVSQYNILAYSLPSNQYVIDDYVPGTQHKYLMDNLDPDTPYDVRLYALSVSDDCTLSSAPFIATVSTLAGEGPPVTRTPITLTQPIYEQRPNVPTQPRFVKYTSTHNQVTVTWHPSLVHYSASSGNQCKVKEYQATFWAWDGDPANYDKETYLATYQGKRIAADAPTTVTFSSLMPSTTYFVNLVALGDAGCEGNRYGPHVNHNITTSVAPTPTSVPRRWHDTPTPTSTPTITPTPEGFLRVTNVPLTLKEADAPTPTRTRMQLRSPAVRNLAVVPSSDSTAEVSWKKSWSGANRPRCNAASTREYRYKVVKWVPGKKIDREEVVEHTTTASTTVTITDLMPGTSYAVLVWSRSYGECARNWSYFRRVVWEQPGG